jgi:pimeloyl-ACP methyl ester carboxylesterase
MFPRFISLSILLASLSLFDQAHAFFGRAEFSLEDDFSDSSVMRGIRADKAICDQLNPGAVWAEVSPSLGECIKYWSAGLTASTQRVVIFLHGDRYGGNRVTADHAKLTGERLSTLAADWSRRIKAPYIYIGRPGTHGSSGDHSRRRTLEEAQILSKTLDALRQRYGIQEFVLSGQSGGGHMTSSLLTLRNDIICAIPASGPSSPRIRYQKMGRTMDTTRLQSYEPTEYFSTNAVHPRLRVFILGDPRDSNVFWESQTILAETLAARGIENAIIEGEAIGSQHHSLNNSARYLAGLCFHDKSTDEIKSFLSKRKIRG